MSDIIVPQFKLGKKAAKQDARTFKMANYVPKLPPVPSTLSWLSGPEAKSGFDWNMLRNDELGDCAIAGPAHMEMLWTHNIGEFPYTPTDEQVVSDYSAVSGYTHGKSETDQGCVILDVMNYWRKTGVCGRKIMSYMSVNPKSIEHIKAAIYLFGAVNVGLALPASAKNQYVWDKLNPEFHDGTERYSWGGHCVIIGKYDTAKKTFTCITWGKRKELTFDFFLEYCDEAFAAVSPSWIAESGLAPSGLDLVGLTNDLKAL